MKYLKIFAVMITVTAMSGCGSSKVLSGQLDYDNEIAYKHGSKDPFNGVAIYNEVPDIVSRYSIDVAGLSINRVMMTASRECDIHFKNGVVEGAVDCFDEEGKKNYHFTIHNGRYDGESDFYLRGKLLNAFNWKDGALDGLQRNYSDDGKYVIHEWTVKDGHKVGKEVRRTSDGDDLAEGEWGDDGKFTGTMFFQDADAPAIYTLKDGVKDGPFKKLDTRNYTDLKHSLVEGSFQNGVADGTLTFYQIGYFEQFCLGGKLTLGGFGQLLKITGIKSLETQWSNGAMQGEIKGLDEDKQALITFHFQDGQIVPPVVRFDPATGKTFTFTDVATISALNGVNPFASRDPNTVLGAVRGPHEEAAAAGAADQRQQSASQVAAENEARIQSVMNPTQAVPQTQGTSASASQAETSQVRSDSPTPAADPTPAAGVGDNWPAMTPCMQKLSDAFVKDAQARGIDSSVSIEQMQEWAATCKALGQ